MTKNNKPIVLTEEDLKKPITKDMSPEEIQFRREIQKIEYMQSHPEECINAFLNTLIEEEKQKTKQYSEGYIIEVGEYSDRQTIAICFDEKIAKSYAKLHNGYIETVPVISDENYITRADKMIKEYSIDYYQNAHGKYCESRYISERYIESDNYEYQNRDNNVFIYKISDMYYDIRVFVDDKERARKIAHDTMAKLIAEKEGL